MLTITQLFRPQPQRQQQQWLQQQQQQPAALPTAAATTVPNAANDEQYDDGTAKFPTHDGYYHAANDANDE